MPEPVTVTRHAMGRCRERRQVNADARSAEPVL